MQLESDNKTWKSYLIYLLYCNSLRKALVPGVNKD